MVKLFGDINVTEESRRTLIFIKVKMSKLKKYNKRLYFLINDLLLVIFLLIPWNWFSYLLRWFLIKMHKVMVLLNSNKDLYYKRKGINRIVKNLTLTEWKYYYMIEWIVIYPIMRLIMIPDV